MTFLSTADLRRLWLLWLDTYFAVPEPVRKTVWDWHMAELEREMQKRGVQP